MIILQHNFYDTYNLNFSNQLIGQFFNTTLQILHIIFLASLLNDNFEHNFHETSRTTTFMQSSLYSF